MKNRTWCSIGCSLFSIAYFVDFLLEGQSTSLLIGNIFLATCFIINAGEEDNE
jgi:hypothetical protein